MVEPEIYVDSTRLIGRLRQTTPTGIDRVELAYAKYFRSTFGRRVSLGLTMGDRLFGLSDERADEFLAAIEAAWTENGTPRTLKGLGDLRRVLGVGVDASVTRPADVSRRTDLRLIFLRTWLKGARPAIAKMFRNAPRATDTLVSVSHTGLGRRGPVRAVLRRTGMRPVFLLHDLIPISHPEYTHPNSPANHRERMETMLSLSRLLIANSEDTRTVAARYARERDLSMPPSVVSHLGLEPVWYEPSRPVVSPHPYFVCIGTIEARKNHLLLLNIWRRLVETRGDAAPRLVIIGRRGWENEQVIDMLERCRQIRGHVAECADLPDVTVKSLLAGSRALLFPSFVEGYGLPLAEAVAARVPIVASDLPVFRELAGDAPDYLDPLDGPAWIRAIDAYAAPDSPERAAQIDRLGRIPPPTWERHFEVVAAEMERQRLV